MDRGTGIRCQVSGVRYQVSGIGYQTYSLSSRLQGEKLKQPDPHPLRSEGQTNRKRKTIQA